MTRFSPSFTGVSPATAMSGSTATKRQLRAAHAAALTAADVIDRWFNNYSAAGVGLYGGTFTWAGDRLTRLTLKGYKLNKDLAVSGKIRWGRFSHQVSVDLTVSGSGVSGHLTGSWDRTAQLWNAASGKRLAPPLQHQGSVNAVAFSPDGKTVLTSDDKTARLWSATHGLTEDVDIVRLTLFVERITATYWNEQGALVPLPLEAWLERGKRLDELGGPLVLFDP